MNFLETAKPLATFAEEKLPMLEKIIAKYNWELTEIVDAIYNDNIRKLCFNGQLTNRNYKEEFIKILKKRDKDKDDDKIEKAVNRK